MSASSERLHPHARIAALLEERAADPRVVEHRERRFFTRYDAWTLPLVRAALSDASFVARLSTPARELFADGSPEFRGPEWLFDVGARVLGRAVLDRVELARAGAALACAPELLDHERELLEHAGLDLDGAWVLLAEYQERIFDAAWPGDARAPSPELALAFGRFACGALAFLPPVPRGDSHRPSERGLDDALNCEPDGWLFLAFAEFAWNAARVRTERVDYWFAMAQLFVALQSVWSAVYAPPDGAEGPAALARSNRRLDVRFGREELEAIVAKERAVLLDRDALARRMAQNAALVLRGIELAPSMSIPGRDATAVGR